MVLNRGLVTGLSILAGSVGVLVAYFYITDNSKNKRRRHNKGYPRGLYNLGNTCYVNALLQALASSSHLQAWLRRYLNPATEDSQQGVSQPFLHGFAASVQAVNCGENATESPESLLRGLLAHGWITGPNTEQDCSELYSVLSTTSEEELSALANRILNHNHIDAALSHDKVDADLIESMDGLSSPGLNRFRVVCQGVSQWKIDQAPFQGLTATRLHCRACGYKYVRQEKFSALQLNIPKAASLTHPATLDASLRQYFAMEFCQLTCERCKANTAANVDNKNFIKKHGITKLPPCLVLQIHRARFMPTGDCVKNSAFLAFPETLDIRDFAFYRPKAPLVSPLIQTPPAPLKGGNAQNCQSDGPSPSILSPASAVSGSSLMNPERYKYRLSAVINHLGGPGSGHFTTYRRGAMGYSHLWFYTSDTTVYRATLEQVLNSEAYMLFYDRIWTQSD